MLIWKISSDLAIIISPRNPLNEEKPWPHEGRQYNYINI